MQESVVRQVPRVLGFAGAALGVELIIGWMLHSEAMVRIVPSSNSVSFNTAIFLLLAGIATVAGDGMHAVFTRRTIAMLVIIGVCPILYENLFDVSLGLDWESLHRSVLDGSARPGRIAPNTCLAILLLGISLLVCDKALSPANRLVVAVCGFGELLLIGSGVVGFLLDPTLLFTWYKFNRMAAPTAVGLSLIGLSIFLRYRSRAAEIALTPTQRERAISFTGAALLLGMGLAGSMTTVVIFANSQQHAIENRLLAEVVGQSKVADILLAQASAETQTLAARPLLRALILQVAQKQDPDQRQRLSQTLGAILHGGFNSISLQWLDASSEIFVGHPKVLDGLILPLKKPHGEQLAWSSEGFVYQAAVTIRTDAGVPFAVLSTERRVMALDSIYSPANNDAASAEIVICGYLHNGIGCFPSKLHPTTLLLPPRAQRNLLPVDQGLAGIVGTRVGNDYRGVTTVAAFSQIGESGLALLSKVDAVQIYAPINALLVKTLTVLAIALLIGTVLLRNLIGPLVRDIVVSQSEAERVARRMKAITDNVPVLIGYLDRNLVYRFVNKTYEAWFGMQADQVLGRTPADILSPEHFAIAKPNFDKVLAGETVSFSRVMHWGPSPTYPKHVNITYIPDRDEHGIVFGFNVLAFDETERHDHELALAHMAHHDSLTRLPNRRLLEDRLNHALQLEKRHRGLTALLYLDVDHFKQINDQHGHECGDMLLYQFSERLQATVRASDTVARLGGDEFVVLMEDLPTKDDVDVVANKILRAIRLPFELNTITVHVTTSIGISFSGRRGISAADFLSQSDQALYHAKRLGRDRYFVRDEQPDAGEARS